jgi:hypothetical protein
MGVRRVRTPEGARRYGLPIGAPIVARPGDAATRVLASLERVLEPDRTLLAPEGFRAAVRGLTARVRRDDLERLAQFAGTVRSRRQAGYLLAHLARAARTGRPVATLHLPPERLDPEASVRVLLKLGPMEISAGAEALAALVDVPELANMDARQGPVTALDVDLQKFPLGPEVSAALRRIGPLPGEVSELLRKVSGNERQLPAFGLFADGAAGREDLLRLLRIADRVNDEEMSRLVDTWRSDPRSTRVVVAALAGLDGPYAPSPDQFLAPDVLAALVAEARRKRSVDDLRYVMLSLRKVDPAHRAQAVPLVADMRLDAFDVRNLEKVLEVADREAGIEGIARVARTWTLVPKGVPRHPGAIGVWREVAAGRADPDVVSGILDRLHVRGARPEWLPMAVALAALSEEERSVLDDELFKAFVATAHLFSEDPWEDPDVTARRTAAVFRAVLPILDDLRTLDEARRLKLYQTAVLVAAEGADDRLLSAIPTVPPELDNDGALGPIETWRYVSLLALWSEDPDAARLAGRALRWVAGTDPASEEYVRTFAVPFLAVATPSAKEAFAEALDSDDPYRDLELVFDLGPSTSPADLAEARRLLGRFGPAASAWIVRHRSRHRRLEAFGGPEGADPGEVVAVLSLSEEAWHRYEAERGGGADHLTAWRKVLGAPDSSTWRPVEPPDGSDAFGMKEATESGLFDGDREDRKDEVARRLAPALLAGGDFGPVTELLGHWAPASWAFPPDTVQFPFDPYDWGGNFLRYPIVRIAGGRVVGRPDRAVASGEPDRISLEDWARYVAAMFVDNWSTTSNDRDPFALAVQERARVLFGLEGTMDWQMEDELRREVDRLVVEVGPWIDRLLVDMWQETQHRHAGQVWELHRGWGHEEGLSGPAPPEGDDVAFALRPLSSWSVSAQTARTFSKGLRPRIAVARVPAERILCHGGGIGFGCLPEREFVVLGGPIRAKVEAPRRGGAS